MMRHSVLCLNTGSSSLKFALFDLSFLDTAADTALNTPVLHGMADRIGSQRSHLRMTYHNKVIRDEALTLPTHEQAFQATLSTFHQISLPTPTTCVHRVVHGGPRLIEPVLVNDSVIQELKNIIVFAPLHLPNEIATIEAAIKAFPDISQIACFDTAFHNHMPEGAKRLPLPRPLWVKGIHRYGFHGLSYEYVVNHLKGQLNGRTIIAHLGNGCSMVALKDGHPQDTTMGLTPTGGLMMGTRSGDLDPGVLFYLLRNEVVHSTDPVARVERMLNDESGLLGVSELSRNMEDLLKAESESTAVREAIELFCYCAIKNIGALSAILGGLDKLVFTGGIGENSPFVQKRICEGLNFLKPYDVLTVHTDENLMMAKHASSLLSKGRT